MKREISNEISNEDVAMVREWIERKRASIQDSGFTLDVSLCEGEVLLFLDLESVDLISRIYLYNTGLLRVDASARDIESLNVDMMINDDLTPVDNLEAVLNYITTWRSLSQTSERAHLS